jgi:hypothetical protein
MHNSDIKAFEVVEEYRQYTLRSVEDPAAIQWLCRAADHGYYHAQSEVGRHYWKGLNGVQKDLPRAYAWYKLAGQSMCRDYSIQLKEILNDMSAEQSSEASFLLDKWVTGQCNKDLIHGMQMEN